MPRDQWGRPLIVPPTGGPARAYVRPSGLPDELTNQFNITKYKLRALAAGMGRRKDLAMHAALLDINEDRKVLDEIVSSAMVMVEEDTGANFGSAVHKVIQNKFPPGAPPEAVLCARGVMMALQSGGYSLVDGTSEVFVVNDHIECAGSLDGLVERGDATYIFDIKTSKAVEDLPDFKTQKWAVQMAIYANFTRGYDFEAGVDLPMHAAFNKLDRHVGVVVYANRSTGDSRLVEVDLDMGWAAAKVARAAYDWKKTKTRHLVKDLGRVSPSTGEITGLVESAEQLAAPVDRINELRKRIGNLSDAQRAELKARWVWPSLVQAAAGEIVLTVAQLVEARQLVSSIEAPPLPVPSDSVSIGFAAAPTVTIQAGVTQEAVPPAMSERDELRQRLRDITENTYHVYEKDKKFGYQRRSSLTVLFRDGTREVTSAEDDGQAVLRQFRDAIRRAEDRMPKDATSELSEQPLKPEDDPVMRAAKRAWLVDRIQALRDVDGGILALKRFWPNGLPTFQSEMNHTMSDLGVIDEALWAAEGAVMAGFPVEPDPEAPVLDGHVDRRDALGELTATIEKEAADIDVDVLGVLRGMADGSTDAERARALLGLVRAFGTSELVLSFGDDGTPVVTRTVQQ